jgi:hypothetical protein
MRITIEVDQETKSMPTTAAQEQPASDAGSPPERLLAEIGTTSESAASTQPVNAGAPPAWLVEAIAAAARSEPGVSGAAMQETATVLDGGTAPASA